jgi:hypothetical protein
MIRSITATSSSTLRLACVALDWPLIRSVMNQIAWPTVAMSVDHTTTHIRPIQRNS